MARIAKIGTRITTTHLSGQLRPGRHGCDDGLYLDVKASGARAWVMRISAQGKIVERGLGPYPQVGLSDARSKIRDWSNELRRGNAVGVRAKKPIQLADTSDQMTFKQAAEAVMALHDASWKSDVHRHQWKQTLKTYAYPVIGDKPVCGVSLDDIEAILLPIWQSKHATATKLLSRIGMTLDWAIAKKLRVDNPAKANGPLQHLLPKVAKSIKHHAALQHAEAAIFMGELRKLTSLSALALEFTVLTAARTSEVIEAKWAEIDLDNALWVIPAKRMKANQEHRVPLSTAAVAILERVNPMAGVQGWVFPGLGSHLSNMAMLQCLRGLRPGLTVHGFRSTFRDWAADQTDYPHEVVEAALAHTVADAVVAAYRRTTFFDKRRSLMADWAAYLAV